MIQRKQIGGCLVDLIEEEGVGVKVVLSSGEVSIKGTAYGFHMEASGGRRGIRHASV